MDWGKWRPVASSCLRSRLETPRGSRWVPVVLGEVARGLLTEEWGRGIGQNGGSNSPALGTKAQASAGLARSSSRALFNLVGGGGGAFHPPLYRSSRSGWLWTGCNLGPWQLPEAVGSFWQPLTCKLWEAKAVERSGQRQGPEGVSAGQGPASAASRAELPGAAQWSSQDESSQALNAVLQWRRYYVTRLTRRKHRSLKSSTGTRRGESQEDKWRPGNCLTAEGNRNKASAGREDGGDWVLDCCSPQRLQCLGCAPSLVWGGRLSPPSPRPAREAFVIAQGWVRKNPTRVFVPELDSSHCSSFSTVTNTNLSACPDLKSVGK